MASHPPVVTRTELAREEFVDTDEYAEALEEWAGEQIAMLVAARRARPHGQRLPSIWVGVENSFRSTDLFDFALREYMDAG